MNESSAPNPGDGTRLSVRVSARTLARLDVLAAKSGLSRARLVRRLLETALADAGTVAVAPDTPGESELLELLSERARQGNVAAIRALLMREEERDHDPRARALVLLQEMADQRQ